MPVFRVFAEVVQAAHLPVAFHIGLPRQDEYLYYLVLNCLSRAHEAEKQNNARQCFHQ